MADKAGPGTGSETGFERASACLRTDPWPETGSRRRLSAPLAPPPVRKAPTCQQPVLQRAIQWAAGLMCPAAPPLPEAPAFECPVSGFPVSEYPVSARRKAPPQRGRQPVRPVRRLWAACPAVRWPAGRFQTRRPQRKAARRLAQSQRDWPRLPGLQALPQVASLYRLPPDREAAATLAPDRQSRMGGRLRALDLKFGSPARRLSAPARRVPPERQRPLALPDRCLALVRLTVAAPPSAPLQKPVRQKGQREPHQTGH